VYKQVTHTQEEHPIHHSPRRVIPLGWKTWCQSSKITI